MRADKDLAAALGAKAGDRVFHSAIVHEKNGVPVQFEERWINPVVAPGYLAQDLLARRTWSGAIAVTRSLLIFPGDCYSLGGRYQVMGETECPVLGSMVSRGTYRPDAGAMASIAEAGRAKGKRPASRRRS